MKPNWDFWKDKKMDYDQRNQQAAGDDYGIGQPPKVGKLRNSYMDESQVFNKELKLSKLPPPRKLV